MSTYPLKQGEDELGWVRDASSRRYVFHELLLMNRSGQDMGLTRNERGARGDVEGKQESLKGSTFGRKCSQRDAHTV